jgi:hypothetical protein
MRGIKSAIQKLKLGWIKKGADSRIVDIGKELKTSERVLVLLPGDPERRSEVLKDAGSLARVFHASEICLVSMPDAGVRELARREGFRSFAPHRQEMSWCGFPNKSFFNRMRNLKSGLVVDLDDEKSCFNAAVSVASRAPLRVGLYGMWGPPVHNVEVKSNEPTNPRASFRSVLSVLSSLKAGAYN